MTGEPQSPTLARWPAVEVVYKRRLLQAEPILKDLKGDVLLLYADVPLLEPGTLLRLLETHRGTKAAMTVLTAELADPYGYGRIVRGADGRMERIIEERDASAEQRAIKEFNSGIYALSLRKLFNNLNDLATDNAQGEYYLTDLVACLLYTSDAADERSSVDLGGRRIIKKKNEYKSKGESINTKK